MGAQVKGLESLYAKLGKIASDEAIMRGIQKACVRVEVDAKVNCPVDDGTLRASITHELKPSELKGVVGTGVEYAPYVEFGTGVYSSKGGGRGTPWSYQDASGAWHTTVGQRPQPFMLPALEDNRDKIIKDIKDSVKQELRRLGE